MSFNWLLCISYTSPMSLTWLKTITDNLHHVKHLTETIYEWHVPFRYSDSNGILATCPILLHRLQQLIDDLPHVFKLTSTAFHRPSHLSLHWLDWIIANLWHIATRTRINYRRPLSGPQRYWYGSSPTSIMLLLWLEETVADLNHVVRLTLMAYLKPAQCRKPTQNVSRWPVSCC